MQYDPRPARHYRPRSNASPSNVSSSVVSAPPTPSDSVSLSTAGSSQRTTFSARGAHTKPPRGLRQTSAEERRRLLLLEQTGLRTYYDSGPVDIPIWPISHAASLAEHNVRGVDSRGANGPNHIIFHAHRYRRDMPYRQ